MIKKISVRNFLSLKEVDLELGQRNVLVGPNMSGKSNLIDCLKFVNTIVSTTPDVGLSKAFLDRGGAREVIWKGGDERRVSFGITAQVRDDEAGGVKEYDYAISILIGAPGTLSVESEQLKLTVQGAERTVFQVDAAGKGEAEGIEGGSRQPLQLGGGRSAFDYIGMVMPEPRRFKSFMDSWRFYQLIPALMRESNAPKPQQFLTERGDNLSSWLMTLQTHPDEFRRIKQVCCDVMPDITDILIEPTQQATVSVSTREKHLKRAIGLARLSDGELAFLALATLIFAPDELSAPLLCIEEPENYLHPYLLETLVELLNQRRQELGGRAAQIIATTHSPYLVDKLDLEDLIVVAKTDGKTGFTRPSDRKHLKKLVADKELGLGELWYSGALARD